jgi:hypothetical protein
MPEQWQLCTIDWQVRGRNVLYIHLHTSCSEFRGLMGIATDKTLLDWRAGASVASSQGGGQI